MALFGKTGPIGITILWLALSPLAFAAGNADDATPASAQATTTEEAGSNIPTLATVTVFGQAEPALTVSETLGREQIDRLPQRNGSINELIGILPGVQLSDDHRTSDNAGEILPPNLSISGGRTYENNFTIDGFSNNSLLDPINTDIDNYSNVPGHPQQIFLHPSLVEKITVYRSNVPAKYGSFTGGVVEVETRDPSATFSGEASLRHTRSQWTALHRDRERREEYSRPGADSVQPEFRKYNGTFLLDMPITANTGLLASYTQLRSKIPLYLVEPPDYTLDHKDQYRSIENFFVKAVTHLGDATKWSLSGTYSPYEAEYFRNKTINGDYTLKNLAYGLTSKLEHRTDLAGFELGLAYSRGTNSRAAVNRFFNWQVTESKPWGAVTDAGAKFPYSREGSYGDVEKEQQTLAANLDVVIAPLGRAVQHNLAFGLKIEQADGRYERTEEFINHTLAVKNAGVLCDEGSIDCIDGEQFMISRTVYPRDSADTRIRFYDVYIEDRVTYGRLTVRPGLRISRDNLQDNTNPAPRLAVGYDLRGDGDTKLYAGYNRYYGKTLLTHALAEEKADFINWSRKTALVDNRPQEWAVRPRTTIAATRLSELDTPRSDEFTVGLDHKLFNGLLSLNYLEREGEDELALTILDKDQETGYQYSEWTNDGRSEHKEASISWERQWRKHFLSLGVTWQETETSNSSYAERADLPDKDGDGSADPVWYRGSLVERADLPRPDFNRDLLGSLVYSTRLPYDFTFTNVTRYRSGYEALANTGEDMVLPSGESYDLYAEVKQPESWQFDWRLEWQGSLRTAQLWIVSLELNNVFNEKVTAGAAEDTYELGRQFWLGMTYKF